MVIGAVLAVGLGILLMYTDILTVCCAGLGYLLVACVALYVPKFFGLKKTIPLLVFGVIFVLIISSVGAFAISKPMLEDNSDLSGYDSSGFSNVNITYSDKKVTITVEYSGTGDVSVYFNQVRNVTYRMIQKASDDDSKHAMEGVGTTYTCTINDVKPGTIYQFRFEAADGDDKTSSISKYYLGAANDSEITNTCLVSNFYAGAIIALLYYLMILLTTWSRKSLEKTRARMEAEGRLYPQGYGRCKECGSIVLPGETCCRKCGAYIDVPEELRHRKVDMVSCSECGAEIPEDAKVCPKCGAVFDEEEEVVMVDTLPEKKDVEMVECSECGAKIPEDSKVCPKCGATFDDDEEIVYVDPEKKE